MLTIERVSKSEYKMKNSEGEIIKEYNKTKMTHPHDWIEDAKDAGFEINGPYGWQFIDKRDE